MTLWWRAYSEAVDDPKLQRLPGDAFKAWFNLMCMASANGGILPSMVDIAFKLRMPEGRAAAIVATLTSAGLIDATETGLVPHNWNGRQFKSDVSTDRVKRFRNGARNVSLAVSETPPETEPYTEAEKKVREKRARGSRLPLEWQPSIADLDYAKARGLNPNQQQTEALKFRNYWTAKAGAGGIKLDWSRTWQNWILNSHPQSGAQNGHHAANPSGKNVSDVMRELLADCGDEARQYPDRMLPEG